MSTNNITEIKTSVMDRPTALAKITADPSCWYEIFKANPSFKGDPEIALAIIQGQPYWYHYIDSHGLNRNKDFMLAVAKVPRMNFFMASSLIYTDRDVALAAVTTSGGNLHHTSPEFQNDDEIVMAAIMSNGMALAQANSRFLEDPIYVSIAVSNNGNILKYLNESFTDDETYVVPALMSSKGKVFEFASARLRDNEKIVWIAFKLDPHNLRFISERLKDEEDFITQCVKADNTVFGNAFGYASERLRKDENFIVNLTTAGYNLSLCGSIKYSETFIQKILNIRKVIAFKKVCDKMQIPYRDDIWTDDAIMSKICMQDVTYFKYASEKLKNDTDFILTVAKKFPERYISIMSENNKPLTKQIRKLYKDYHILVKSECAKFAAKKKLEYEIALQDQMITNKKNSHCSDSDSDTDIEDEEKKDEQKDKQKKDEERDDQKEDQEKDKQVKDIKKLHVHTNL
jgi:hypothetical protein